MAQDARFEVERELGRGGMGIVLLARDRERGGERVALKRLAPEVDASSLLAEFESARKLRHPVIVTVRDFGRDAEGAFLTMEYVDGDDLTVMVGKVEPERVARWALLIADALEYARRRGYVHGDLKPQNLRVPRAEPRSIRLLDLGLARLAGRAATGGTPAYLAPEVLDGKPPDVRSDLWSLGCVLFECLTGKPAYPGIDRTRPRPALPEGTPPRLAHVVETLLKRRPEDRPGRPADLVLLLGDAPDLRLPLPDGDLVGRGAVLERVKPGRVVLLEAAAGMGATRLLRELGERAEVDGTRLLAIDVEEADSRPPGELLRAAREGAAVVAAFRPGRLTAVEGAEVMPLDRLSEEGLLTLVASRMPLEPQGARAVSRWAWRESGGSPALAVEALECLRDADLLRPGPLGLEADADALEALAPETRPGFSSSRLGRVLARLEPDLLAAAARLAVLGPGAGHPRLEEAGVLVRAEDGGALRFASEGLRRALEATLDAGSRRALHGEAADALLASSTPDAEPAPAAIGRHLLGAGRDLEAGPWLRRAGREAASRGERREALYLFSLAVDRLAPGAERADARLALAAELRVAGKHQAAWDMYREVRAEDPSRARESWILEAELLAERKENAGARAAALEGIRLARVEGGERDRARALYVLGRVSAQRARYPSARRHLENALCLYRRLGDELSIALCANALGNVAYATYEYDGAIEAYREAHGAAERVADRKMAGVALTNLGRIYVEQRRSDQRARPVIEAAVIAAEADGDRARLARTLGLLAVLDFDAGRPDEARRSLERAVVLQDAMGDRVGSAYVRLRLSEILTTSGRFVEAAENLHEVLGCAHESGEGRLEAAALDDLGHLALERSDPVAARGPLEAALRTSQTSGEVTREVSVRASLALTHLALGDACEARRIVDAAPSVHTDEREVAAQFDRARAALLMTEGRLQDARGVLEALLPGLQDTGFELELARTLLDLGAVLGRLGKRDGALEALDQARAIFDRRAAKPLLARALLAKARLKAEARW